MIDLPASAEAARSIPIPQRCTLVLPSNGLFDSRTYRIASSLASRGHAVTVIARGEPGLAHEETHEAGYRILRVGGPTVAGRGSRRRARWTRVQHAGSTPARLIRGVLAVRSQGRAAHDLAPTADLVHAMAYMGIPIGLDLGRRDRAPVVYDARDIYVDAANLARLPGPIRWLAGGFERRWARRAQRVVTVNRAFAQVMSRRFGVAMPLIVQNCSYRREPSPDRPNRIRDALGLGIETRIVLYHGGFSRDRGIEQLIEALPALPDDVVVVLLGYGRLGEALERRAASPSSRGRLQVLPAVPPSELLDWVASADLVAMPIQPTTLNHRLTTPNKLFEAMAAGVPVVASDLPGMAGIVRDTGCGLLVDPTSAGAIAVAIRAILDAPAAERDAYRERAVAAARGQYNWETQVEILLAEYGRLTGRPW